MIFVDSNIVIDVLERSSKWSSWSRARMEEAVELDLLVTSLVVLAETAGRFTSLAEQLAYFADLGLTVRDLDPRSAHRAGRAHRAYRRAGGTREAILADFLIGAHAAVLGAALLTRDRQRFAGYFPDLTLITPESHP